MTAPTFAQPEYAGSGYVLKDHLGHLLAYLPVQYETGIMTKFQKAGEEPKDAVTASVICVDCEEEYSDVRVFQARLIGVTRARIGEIVLGRLAQEPSPQGNPAWALAPFTDADVARATDYWNRRTAGGFKQPAASSGDGERTRSVSALKSQLG